MGKTFDIGACVEIQRDPGGIWKAARYERPGTMGIKGWHWVHLDVGFLTKVLVPSRRIRAAKEGGHG